MKPATLMEKIVLVYTNTQHAEDADPKCIPLAASILDQVQTDWFKKVDTTTLAYDDVLTQVFNGWTHGRAALGRVLAPTGERLPPQLLWPFATDHVNVWIREIKKRRKNA